MDPMTISALIGLAGNLLGNKMKGDQAEAQAPGNLLAQMKPGSALQGLQNQFMVPGMQKLGARSMGQQLLGG